MALLRRGTRLVRDSVSTAPCFNTSSKIPYDDKERGSQKSKSGSFKEWVDFTTHCKFATTRSMERAPSVCLNYFLTPFCSIRCACAALQSKLPFFAFFAPRRCLRKRSSTVKLWPGSWRRKAAQRGWQSSSRMRARSNGLESTGAH